MASPSGEITSLDSGVPQIGGGDASKRSRRCLFYVQKRTASRGGRKFPTVPVIDNDGRFITSPPRFAPGNLIFAETPRKMGDRRCRGWGEGGGWGGGDRSVIFKTRPVPVQTVSKGCFRCVGEALLSPTASVGLQSGGGCGDEKLKSAR